MNLSELSLKRPVLAIVCSIVIIIFGIIGFNFLGVREYPAIDPPVVNVRTQYTGANAEIIEQQITEPLEKAVNGVEGVKNITSSSSQGSSNITVEFELGVDLERAANDVREKVSQASNALPQDIDAPPSVAKQDAVAYIRTNLEFHRTLYLRAQAPAMLAMTETVWLQLGPTMRALYAKLRRNEPPHHHRVILAALKAGDEPGLRLAVRTDVTQGLRHLAG
jgi:hypothetical protein